MDTHDEPDPGGETPRERISRLSAAILRISASLDVATVLREVVESARALTGARNGIIAAVDEAGRPREFVMSGLTPEQERAITGWLPDGLRLFEHLRDLEAPLRCELSVPDGRRNRMLINVTPIRFGDGAVESVVVTVQDLAPLEALERLRAEFLAMVSHELRVPLTSIKGSTAALSRTARRSSARRRAGAGATGRCRQRSAWRCWARSWRWRPTRRGEAPRAPSRAAAGVLRRVAGPAPGTQPPLRHGGCRHGGAVGVPHAVAVVPGAPARTRSNAHTLFGLDRIPCDNHIRQLLDGVPTAHLDGQFRAIAEDLDARGALAPMRRLGGRLLVALDGTEFFRSRSIHCPNCSTRKRSDGATEHFHQMLTATVVAPGHARTLALAPEFVQRRDGLAKQDCEREAAKRWLQHHGLRCAALRPVYLGDDLYACQPVCRAMLDSGGDFLLTAKPASHQTLYEYLDGIRAPTRHVTASMLVPGS